MKKTLCLFLSIATLAFSEKSSAAEFDDFEKSLLEGIEEVSDIATRTKLNIDDTPAFVTMYYSDDFEEYGIDSVYEALSLIPGVELTVEATGVKTVTFRGGREKGKIKLLIDGIAINNTYRGSMYHYLNFPVELVDRIEVIRGPGSVLYGSNAINGVINIVTKNQTTRAGTFLFGSSATYGQNKAGFSRIDTVGDHTIALDGYYLTANKMIEAGTDKSGYDGKSDESSNDYSVGVTFRNTHWKLTGRTKSTTQGLGYGAGYYLERRHDKNGLINGTDTAELLYRTTLDATDLIAKIGYKNYRQTVETRYYPESIVSLSPSYGGAGLGDLIYGSDYEEVGTYADLSMGCSRVIGHHFIVGAYVDSTRVTMNDLEIYREADPTTRYLSQNLLKKKAERQITALYFQDSFEIAEKTDITAGIRQDSYSDFGDAISPRIAAVYRLDQKSNLKVMYTRAFRAPSWTELYGSLSSISMGNSDMKAETSDTFEIGLVSKEDVDNLLRVNLFYTNVNDIIYRVNGQYVQDGISHFYGGELEYRKRLGLDTTLTAILSDTEGFDRKNNAVTDIANQLAAFRIGYKFKTRLFSGTNIRYVSPRRRAEGDTRDDLEGYTTLDQSFSYRFSAGALVSVSIKNLLDADIRYPSPPDTYTDDFPREGRTFWLKASWEI